jgi:hypothetical protein
MFQISESFARSEFDKTGPPSPQISVSGDFENDGFTIIGCNSSLECGPETDGGYRIWAKGGLSASDGGTVMGRYVRWHVSSNFTFSSEHGGVDGRGLIR